MDRITVCAVSPDRQAAPSRADARPAPVARAMRPALTGQGRPAQAPRPASAHREPDNPDNRKNPDHGARRRNGLSRR